MLSPARARRVDPLERAAAVETIAVEPAPLQQLTDRTAWTRTLERDVMPALHPATAAQRRHTPEGNTAAMEPATTPQQQEPEDTEAVAAAAMRYLTHDGVVPVELITRHRAALRLNTWSGVTGLDRASRVRVLTTFRPGPRQIPYGQPFTPLPTAVCRCGLQITRFVERGVVRWDHDPEMPPDGHRPLPRGGGSR